MVEGLLLGMGIHQASEIRLTHPERDAKTTMDAATTIEFCPETLPNPVIGAFRGAKPPLSSLDGEIGPAKLAEHGPNPANPAPSQCQYKRAS